MSTSRKASAFPQAPDGMQLGGHLRSGTDQLRHAGSGHLRSGTDQLRHAGRSECLTSVFRYGTASLACGLFSLIYEGFSHGVLSVWMILLFAYPLVLGVVPALVAHIVQAWISDLARQLWACGVMTLTVGSCLRGVLEIYGTTSALVEVYLPCGLVLLVLATVVQSLRCRQKPTW